MNTLYTCSNSVLHIIYRHEITSPNEFPLYVLTCVTGVGRTTASICNIPAEKTYSAELVFNSWQSSTSSIDDHDASTCFQTQKYFGYRNLQNAEMLFELRSSVKLGFPARISAKSGLVYKHPQTKFISIYLSDKPLSSLKREITAFCNDGNYTQNLIDCSVNAFTFYTDYMTNCEKSVTGKYTLLRRQISNFLGSSNIENLNVGNLLFYGKAKCNYYLHIEKEEQLIDGGVLTVSVKSDSDAKVAMATCKATITNSNSVFELNHKNGDFQHNISCLWNNANITCKVAGQQLQKTIFVHAKPTINVQIISNSKTKNNKLLVRGAVVVNNYNLFPNADFRCFITSGSETKNIELVDSTTAKILNMSSLSVGNCIVASVYTARLQISLIETENAVINCTFNGVFSTKQDINKELPPTVTTTIMNTAASTINTNEFTIKNNTIKVNTNNTNTANTNRNASDFDKKENFILILVFIFLILLLLLIIVIIVILTIQYFKKQKANTTAGGANSSGANYRFVKDEEHLMPGNE